MRRASARSLGGLIVLVTALAAGCATAPPARVTEMSQIAGNWSGTITRGFNGAQELYYMTIDPAGKITAQWGMNWWWGQITLANGQAQFEIMDRTTGTLTYYEGQGGRSIEMRPLFGEWYVQVRPAAR